MRSSSRTADFLIHTDTNDVQIGSRREKLTPKEMGVLKLLMDRRDTTVSRTEILDKVWGDKYANDQGLTQAISRLRGILHRSRNVTITTIPKKGYHLQCDKYGERKSVVKWLKSHAAVMIIMFLSLIICYLIFIQPIGIRIQKRVLDPQEKPTSSF